jgi:hypothetical protein
MTTVEMQARRYRGFAQPRQKSDDELRYDLERELRIAESMVAYYEDVRARVNSQLEGIRPSDAREEDRGELVVIE